MKELAENKATQNGLEETIFQSLKALEAKGKYTQNDPLTRETAKRLVDEFVIHAKNWMYVTRAKPKEVHFNPGVLGVVLNQYMQILAVACQF